MSIIDSPDSGNYSDSASHQIPPTAPANPAVRADDRRPIKGVTRAMLEAMAARAPERKPVTSATTTRPSAAVGDVFSRARSYLATIPGAVAGQRGHDRTFYAANRLVRGYALDPDAAYPLLAEWNTKCNPPWSERELRHKLEQAARQPGPRGFLLTAKPDAPQDGAKELANRPLRNFRWEEVPDGETMRKVKCGRSVRDIADEITNRTFGWPKRCGPRLFVIDQQDRPEFLRQTPDLFAWLNLTLSNSTGASPIDWAGGSDMPGKDELRAGLHHVVDQYDQLEVFPHEPPLLQTYYYHPEPTGGDGQALYGLLRQLNPATPHDEDLLLAMLLTFAWGGPPGARPAFLITAEEEARDSGRGAGKTKTVEKLATLFGGVMKVTPDQDFGRWCDSYISGRFAAGATGHRVLLLDNLKALRFSDADIESLITGQTISGHLMYHGLVQVPNTLTVVMTGNAPSLGKDMAQRVITIELRPAAFTAKWELEVEAYIAANRWAIIGDLLATLRKTAGEIQDPLRWGTWCGEVLSKCTSPDDLISLVRARQKLLDADDDNAEQLRAGIVSAVATEMRVKGIGVREGDADHSLWKGNPESKAVLLSSSRLATIYNEVFGEKLPTQKVTGILKTSVTVRGLRYSRRGSVRGWVWIGDECSEVNPMFSLE
jgi:hypothetical protein